MQAPSINNPVSLQSKYFITCKILGRGSFADVKLAIDKSTGERIAVKIFDQSATYGANVKAIMTMQEVRNEVSLLKVRAFETYWILNHFAESYTYKNREFDIQILYP